MCTIIKFTSTYKKIQLAVYLIILCQIFTLTYNKIQLAVYLIILSQIFTLTYNKIQLKVYLIEAILMITHNILCLKEDQKIIIMPADLQLEHRCGVDLFYNLVLQE